MTRHDWFAEGKKLTISVMKNEHNEWACAAVRAMVVKLVALLRAGQVL